MAYRRNPLMCPRCDGIDVRRSHRLNLLERFMSIAAIRPFRCIECGYRFWRLAKHTVHNNRNAPSPPRV